MYSHTYKFEGAWKTSFIENEAKIEESEKAGFN